MSKLGRFFDFLSDDSHLTDEEVIQELKEQGINLGIARSRFEKLLSKMKTHRILLNGLEQEFDSDEISFDELVAESGYDNEVPFEAFTVTYRKGVNKAEGTLIKGDKISITDGMIFTVVITNNA